MKASDIIEIQYDCKLYNKHTVSIIKRGGFCIDTIDLNPRDSYKKYVEIVAAWQKELKKEKDEQINT